MRRNLGGGGHHKELLIKKTIFGKTSKILTCSMIVSRGQPVSLVFNITPTVGRRTSEKFEIDLRKFKLYDSTEMKDKVLWIVKDAMDGCVNLKSKIIEAFEAQSAADVLQALVFTSSDGELGQKSVEHNSSEEVIKVLDDLDLGP